MKEHYEKECKKIICSDSVVSYGMWKHANGKCLSLIHIYVAEIIRSGIQAVDAGQTEAAKSLGMSGFHTMTRVILPQAVKNILPALGNEFIVMIKEASLSLIHI